MRYDKMYNMIIPKLNVLAVMWHDNSYVTMLLVYLKYLPHGYILILGVIC